MSVPLASLSPSSGAQTSQNNLQNNQRKESQSSEKHSKAWEGRIEGSECRVPARHGSAEVEQFQDETRRRHTRGISAIRVAQSRTWQKALNLDLNFNIYKILIGCDSATVRARGKAKGVSSALGRKQLFTPVCKRISHPNRAAQPRLFINDHALSASTAHASKPASKPSPKVSRAARRKECLGWKRSFVRRNACAARSRRASCRSKSQKPKAVAALGAKK
eukprot:scaffold1878_cov258-Pinguiococcus_pyrenoidosus.AAC.11